MVLGLIMIIAGALATVVAMFLNVYEYAEGDLADETTLDTLTWWEAFNGLDIALVASCGLSVCLAFTALRSGNRVPRQLAAMAAALTFAFAFAIIPDTIHEQSEYAAVGLWVVGASGALALVGGIVTTLTRQSQLEGNGAAQDDSASTPEPPER